MFEPRFLFGLLAKTNFVSFGFLMIAMVLVSSIVIFILGYVYYGRKISALFDLQENKPTPAHCQRDGVDYVPTPTPILMGHHFASIAGAGPIVGPVVAALAFGWLPVLCWILVGAIFIGGVHDVTSLIASIRHKAKSIAGVARENMSRRAYFLFLAFIWLALVYVITVFMDLTSTTFVMSGGAASSSVFFILLALGFGIAHNKLKISFSVCTIVFVPMLIVAVWVGDAFPTVLTLGDPKKTWDIILVCYCFAASITPVWLLLQPRDYLSSYCLYISAAGAFLGILFGGFSTNFPAYIGFKAGPHQVLYPLLFINVACGACSGFHSLVSSGTTSKQLDRETDAVTVGYGAMLIEGVVAVIALCTVMTIGRGDALCSKSPLFIYSVGLGKFFNVLGLDLKTGQSFALLAISTFILTTLDTATRLGRYILEEIFETWEVSVNRYISTAVTLLLPLVLVMITMHDASGKPIPAWKAIWPVFGATNQLLAGLTLLTITIWLRKMGKGYIITLLPMLFMLITSMWALVLIVNNYGFSLIGLIAAVLFMLGTMFGVEACSIFMGRPSAPAM